jgi:hypothetical protein
LHGGYEKTGEEKEGGVCFSSLAFKIKLVSLHVAIIE